MYEVVLSRYDESVWNKGNSFMGRAEVLLSGKAVAATNQDKARWRR